MELNYDVYDIHSHLGKTSSGEENSPEQMLDELREYGITKVGVSSLSGISMQDQNNLVASAQTAHPDAIYGYGFINPKAPDALDEVERCLCDLHLKGIKFHSWKHGYYPDNTLALKKIFELIARFDVQVQTHVGTAPFSTPYTWLPYAEAFPSIDFVFTHIGYYEFGHSTIEAVAHLPHVHVETSGQMDPLVLVRAVHTLGAERVCFGTDWPYKPVNLEIEKFFHLGLNEGELEYILNKNARRLWRME